MKPPPPSPGWIERVYRTGVGIAIPLTIVAGLVLLLTEREPESPAHASERRDRVLMAMPLDDPRRTVELRPASRCSTPAGAATHTPCPPAAAAR